MAKYLFVYHGGKNPESEEEVAEVLDAWGAWFGDRAARTRPEVRHRVAVDIAPHRFEIDLVADGGLERGDDDFGDLRAGVDLAVSGAVAEATAAARRAVRLVGTADTAAVGGVACPVLDALVVGGALDVLAEVNLYADTFDAAARAGVADRAILDGRIAAAEKILHQRRNDVVV